ncbi:signal peptidase I [Gimesia fumaroli]|uniref:signal peptidase I n=1 Tax=Gimesia fumaroli TaxID=2527976 RepID=UPI0018D6502F
MVRPYLFETYSLPSNAMAATILGPHHRGVCPECGATSYYAAHDPTKGLLPQLMICDHFHEAKVSDADSETYPDDEILVAKLRKPERWDLAVFQHPYSPSILLTKRLVGLPGEKITIQDGAIYADGKKLTPPTSLQGLKYHTEMEDGPGQPLWGSPERPAQLGDDEFFVLGDFSARSADSRTWKEGAPNRASYAVPESHLKGVVTHIIRPFHRMRVLD